MYDLTDEEDDIPLRESINIFVCVKISLLTTETWLGLTGVTILKIKRGVGLVKCI